MSPKRLLLLLLATLAILSLAACSDDDDDPVDPGTPEDPRVETIDISPEEVTFPSIGVDEKFEATAFDQNGAVIDTVFVWQSSNENVVVVGQDGVAVATGLGTAEIYSTAGSASDTAQVTVTVGTSPLYEWIAGGSGDWGDATNWSDNQVPGAGDIALIDADGDYTVTLGNDVVIEALILGGGSGTQTLDTAGFHLQVNTGGLYPESEVTVSGSLTIQGEFAWLGGIITGTGTMTVQSGAELHALGNPLELRVDLDNAGTITMGTGSSFRVNNTLEGSAGSVVELQGDAFLTVQNNGSFTSSGTIHKSLGEEAASIVATSLDDAEFSSSGPIVVDAGTLYLSEGSLSGSLDIDSEARLELGGSTELLSANMRGDGPLVITGRVNLGFFQNQIINIPYLILDSSRTPSLSGIANLVVDRKFVWRRGMVTEMESITCQIGSETTFEEGGAKVIQSSRWSINGNVTGESNLDIELRNGAAIHVLNSGNWMQTAGGTISQGTGDPGLFDVKGMFHKTGEGAFVVETGFTCSGTLDLVEGVVTVQGDFELAETGVITGGGTAETYDNKRLILIDAPTAVMRGTIRPDLDGQPARLDIQGLTDLMPTFRIEVDVVTGGDFNTESVVFHTSGQVFGGTLVLNALTPPEAEVDYKVVYSYVAREEFEIENGEPFLSIVQDGNGVVCRR
jgi:phage baseplate assembly protein gpV